MKDITEDRVLFEGDEYPITPEIKAQIEAGIVPVSLQETIILSQGEESRREFVRWCRYRRRILDQIAERDQPASIQPVIEDNIILSQILYKIYHHNLGGNAEKLYGRGLITKEVLETVQSEVITQEILAPLTHAVYVDIALYLFGEGEINQQTLEGVREGQIDPKMLRVIWHYHHCLINAEASENRMKARDRINQTSPESCVEQGLMAQYRKEHLDAALACLSPFERDLIMEIYFERTPMSTIAKRMGCNERTIRYHRDNILKKLKIIYQDVFRILADEVFD